MGFILGFACLNLYIDPSLHPVIDQQDPRWLGAWWLGWLILGSLLALFTFLIAMFPRELEQPASKETKKVDKVISCKLIFDVRPLCEIKISTTSLLTWIRN